MLKYSILKPRRWKPLQTFQLGELRTTSEIQTAVIPHLQMENGDLPKIAQVAEPLIELELYLSFPFSSHSTVCVGSSCTGPQLRLWRNKWRRARIVFYIKWPNLGRDEIVAQIGPKWVTVLAFNSISSFFFDWLLHIFCFCLFRVRALQMSFERGSCQWSPATLPKAALSAF